MSSIETLEQAIAYCEEHCLKVEFKINYIVISDSADELSGHNLLVQNKDFLKGVKTFKEAIDKIIKKEPSTFFINKSKIIKAQKDREKEYKEMEKYIKKNVIITNNR